MSQPCCGADTFTLLFRPFTQRWPLAGVRKGGGWDPGLPWRVHIPRESGGQVLGSSSGRWSVGRAQLRTPTEKD